jgi:three-Cys-motif partner protein
VNEQFHKQGFDDGTKLKLDIFRRYIREWISVFLTDSPSLSAVTSINIFDLFSGPGEDAEGNPGSPVIIAGEMKSYCETREALRARKPIRMYFNDWKSDKISRLRDALNLVACKRGCCQTILSDRPFEEVLRDLYPAIQDSGSANLVIMDQFGISDATSDVVRLLANCLRTDILFFVPSSYIRRFQNHPAFRDKFDLTGMNLEYNTVHRFICEYYREKLGTIEYHLAPFSIKTGGNIHGVVFGTSHLYGLEKFLKVCWDIDPTTGEANYSVDQDPAWGGNECLFPELNAITRVDLFSNDLRKFIEKSSPTNMAMYRFVLSKGFTPTRAGAVLKNLQESGWLQLVSLGRDQKVKKGSYYLNHREKVARIRFQKTTGVS